ncbi:MAG: NrfD/PsrC family molybdoenzyme membrane anchor subunit [Actinomycetota bacterium]
MATHNATLSRQARRSPSAWHLVVAVLVALVVLGIYAYAHELSEGMAVTGLRNIGPMGGATWGLYITFVVYFVGLSFAGISTAALIRLARIDRLRPISRMAELLTVVALVLAGLAIIADLGQPLRGIVNLLRYARPQSPFFGTFTLVISGYLFASLVYLYLDGRRDAWLTEQTAERHRGFYRFWAAGYRDTPAERERHDRATFWLAIAIVPLLITAHSTLGFVFGLQVGRPGWFSALQAPSFVILAGVSGLGMLAMIVAAVRRRQHREEELGVEIFKWLSTALVILVLSYLYLVVVELLTNLYTGSSRERDVMSELLFGDYAWIYWGAIGCFVGALVLLIFRVALPNLRGAVWPVVVAGALVNLGAIGKRYLIVVPSQTKGTLLPYDEGSYTPAWTEFALVIGLISLGVLSYMLFTRYFPIVEHPQPEPAEREEAQ